MSDDVQSYQSYEFSSDEEDEDNEEMIPSNNGNNKDRKNSPSTWFDSDHFDDEIPDILNEDEVKNNEDEQISMISKVLNLEDVRNNLMMKGMDDCSERYYSSCYSSDNPFEGLSDTETMQKIYELNKEYMLFEGNKNDKTQKKERKQNEDNHDEEKQQKQKKEEIKEIKEKEIKTHHRFKTMLVRNVGSFGDEIFGVPMNEMVEYEGDDEGEQEVNTMCVGSPSHTISMSQSEDFLDDIFCDIE